jgi:hypothetical protein
MSSFDSAHARESGNGWQRSTRPTNIASCYIHDGRQNLTSYNPTFSFSLYIFSHHNNVQLFLGRLKAAHGDLLL